MFADINFFINQVFNTIYIYPVLISLDCLRCWSFFVLKDYEAHLCEQYFFLLDGETKNYVSQIRHFTAILLLHLFLYFSLVFIPLLILDLSSSFQFLLFEHFIEQCFLYCPVLYLWFVKNKLYYLPHLLQLKIYCRFKQSLL